MKFKPQLDEMDCGPACLAMISSNFSKNYSISFFREKAFITRQGISLMGISEASKKIGLETISAKLNTVTLIENNDTLPCILH